MSMDLAIGIAGLILSVVGIPLSIYLARRGRERPDIRHLTDFDVVISPEDALLNRGLSMKFGGHSINTVSRTIFAIWNQKGSTVLGTDVVPSDRLRLQLEPKDSVLRARLISFSRTQIKAALVTNPDKNNQVVVDFDFLDPGDGMIVEVLHEGPKRPSIEGTIRGARLTSNGSGDLTAKKLDFMTETSRKVKAKKTIENQGGLFALIFAAVNIALALGTVAYFGFRYFAYPENVVIPPTDFDLTTPEGQKEFSSAVSAHHNYIGPIPAVYAFAILGFALIALTVLRLRRRRGRTVPKTIVQHRLTDEPTKHPKHYWAIERKKSVNKFNEASRAQVASDQPHRDRESRPASLKLEVGDRVKHIKYGLGVVKTVDGEGTRSTATIDFGEAGRVRLMLIGGVPMHKVSNEPAN